MKRILTILMFILSITVNGQDYNKQGVQFGSSLTLQKGTESDSKALMVGYRYYMTQLLSLGAFFQVSSNTVIVSNYMESHPFQKKPSVDYKRFEFDNTSFSINIEFKYRYEIFSNVYLYNKPYFGIGNMKIQEDYDQYNKDVKPYNTVLRNERNREYKHSGEIQYGIDFGVDFDGLWDNKDKNDGAFSIFVGLQKNSLGENLNKLYDSKYGVNKFSVGRLLWNIGLSLMF